MSPGLPRVAIDYLPATTHFPGVGRYARELVRALVRLPRAERGELVLFEWGSEPRAIGEPWLGLDGHLDGVERVSRRLPRRLLELRARIGFDAASSCGALDLFHRIHAHYPPLRGVRQLWPVPELPARGTAAETALRARLAEFDAFLVASRDAGERLQRDHGIAAARIHRVRTGCEHWLREQRDPVARLEPAQLVVLGALRAGRGHRAILEAFARLHARKRAARLLLIGSDGPERVPVLTRAAELGLATCVEWIGQPIESRMPRVMAESAALVHLSDGELTPVTPLEACASGAGVLASPLPAFLEALGEEAVWAPPAAVEDPAELARLLERAVELGLDPAAQARRRALAGAYTWEANARATLDAWRKLAGHPAGASN